MTADSKEEIKCSENKINKEDGLKTVDGLRGRLLAERQSSKAANEDAEQLSKKLVELENLIKVEIKLRDRAEKKLNFLMKKVKSLKTSPISEELEQSSSTSENCSSSCRSTITSSSGTRDHDLKEAQLCVNVSKQDMTDETLDHNAVDNTSNQSQDSSLEQNLSSPYNDVGEDSSSEESKIDSQSTSSLKDPRVGVDTREGSERDEDCIDNSLALVPISPPARSDDEPNMVSINVNVSEVLDNLRQLREKLQSSLEKRRHIIKVGPT